MRSRADATHSIKQIEISAPLKKTKDEELASFLQQKGIITSPQHLLLFYLYNSILKREMQIRFRILAVLNISYKNHALIWQMKSWQMSNTLKQRRKGLPRPRTSYILRDYAQSRKATVVYTEKTSGGEGLSEPKISGVQLLVFPRQRDQGVAKTSVATTEALGNVFDKVFAYKLQNFTHIFSHSGRVWTLVH